MKIRSLEHLDDALDAEISWRKKELSMLMNNYESAGPNKQDHTLRIAIFLIYAHWEGFIKRASEIYLEYVSHQRVKLDEVNLNLLALALESCFDNQMSLTNIRHKKDIVDLITKNLNSYTFQYKEGQVNTQSNLNIDTLEKICLSLGINKDLLDVDDVWIDERLLKYRNMIAHGEKLIEDRIPFDLKELKNKIQDSLEKYKNLISNAAFLKSYLKINSTQEKQNEYVCHAAGERS